MSFDNVEFTNHEAYLEIAHEKLNLAKETDTDLHIKIGVTSLNYRDVNLSPENCAYLLFGLQLINKSNIISIIFSALAAESFINYYALQHGKTKSYLRTFRGNPENQLSEAVVKWINIPNDITGKFALTEGSTEVNNLQKLFSNRNKLAHHRAIIKNLNGLDLNNIEDPNSITTRDAENGFLTTIDAIKSIKKIDEDFDISWLNT
jgi:hypothetical protein